MSEIMDVDWREASRLMDDVETCCCDGCHVYIAESFKKHRIFTEQQIIRWLRGSSNFINGHAIADAIEAKAHLK